MSGSGLSNGRAWFAGARFGMFVHFGLYTLLGGNENDYRNWKQTKQAYAAQLLPCFDPSEFDADTWVRLFKENGARYLVLTTKHGEGFCLWHTKQTAFNVSNTPFRRDIVAEVAEACHRHGMRLGFYFSSEDWFYEEPGEGTEEAREYATFVEAQLRELLTGYGQVDEIWFDGHDPRLTLEVTRGLIEMIHTLQPTCVVNDRGVNHSALRNVVLGDFVTPERQIPEYVAPGAPFVECCDAMGLKGWGYHAQQEFWSAAELIRRLGKVAAIGGNYLLNVEPMASGRIREECTQRLQAIGRWLSSHPGAVFGSSGCELMPRETLAERPAIGCATRNDNDIYLHLHDWPQSDVLMVQHLRTLPEGAELIGCDAPLTVVQGKDGVRIGGLPPSPPHPSVSVIRLRFGKSPEIDVEAIASARRPLVVLPQGETARLLPTHGERIADSGVPWHHLNRFANGNVSIGHLIRQECGVAWRVEVKDEALYHVIAELGTASMQKGATFTLGIAGQTLRATTVENGWYDCHQRLWVGAVKLPPGRHEMVLRIEQMESCFSDIHGIILDPQTEPVAPGADGGKRDG